MAETAPWGNLPSYEQEPPPPPSSGVNGWGIAGFVLGMVSLCGSGGLTAPIGLLLSLIGLFKTPRGWAVAGLATNTVSLCCCAFSFPIMLVALGFVSLSAMTLWITTSFKGSLGPAGVTVIHASAIGIVLAIYFGEHKSIPQSLNDLKLDAAVLNDGWGRPFHFRVTSDPEGYVLWSAGGDGADDTGDDIRFRGKVDGSSLSFEPERPRRTSTPSSAPAAPGATAPPDSSGAPPSAPAAPPSAPAASP